MKPDQLPGIGWLPPRLDELLMWLQVLERQQLVVSGASAACADDNHRLAPWLTGIFKGRVLRLAMCLDCETVEVRDTTRTRWPVVGSKPTLNSPDDLLGWYSGARASNRVYL